MPNLLVMVVPNPPLKNPLLSLSLSLSAPTVFAESIPRKQGVYSENGATGCNYVMLVELNNYSGGSENSAMNGTM